MQTMFNAAIPQIVAGVAQVVQQPQQQQQQGVRHPSRLQQQPQAVRGAQVRKGLNETRQLARFSSME